LEGGGNPDISGDTALDAVEHLRPANPDFTSLIQSAVAASLCRRTPKPQPPLG